MLVNFSYIARKKIPLNPWSIARNASRKANRKLIRLGAQRSYALLRLGLFLSYFRPITPEAKTSLKSIFPTKRAQYTTLRQINVLTFVLDGFFYKLALDDLNNQQLKRQVMISDNLHLQDIDHNLFVSYQFTKLPNCISSPYIEHQDCFAVNDAVHWWNQLSEYSETGSLEDSSHYIDYAIEVLEENGFIHLSERLEFHKKKNTKNIEIGITHYDFHFENLIKPASEPLVAIDYDLLCKKGIRIFDLFSLCEKLGQKEEQSEAFLGCQGIFSSNWAAVSRYANVTTNDDLPTLWLLYKANRLGISTQYNSITETFILAWAKNLRQLDKAVGG